MSKQKFILAFLRLANRLDNSHTEEEIISLSEQINKLYDDHLTKILIKKSK